MQAAQADDRATQIKMEIVMRDGMVEGLDHNATQLNGSLTGHFRNLRRNARRDALDLGDAPPLSHVAVGAVARGAHDHRGEVAQARLELLTGKAGKLAGEFRAVGTADRRVRGPVDQTCKRNALLVEELEEDDLVVGESARNVAVVVVARDYLLAQARGRRLRVGAALLKSIADGLQQPVVVVLIELIRPPAAMIRNDGGVIVRDAKQHGITVDAIARCQQRLDLLGHLLLDFHEVGGKHEDLALAIAEQQRVGVHVIVDSGSRMQAILKIAVADEIHIALRRELAACVSNIHMRSFHSFVIVKEMAWKSAVSAPRPKPEFIAS